MFALYLMTLAPTVLYYDQPLLLDSAMYQIQAILLGITGPTGEPGWTLLTHLFTYLPVGDLAYRVNLASAVYAAGTVALVFATGMLLARRVGAALLGALAMGLGGTFWSQAVIAENYTLNTLLILPPIICLLLWQRERRDRHLLLACFFGGLAMTNHMTSALVVPAAFLFVGLVDRWKFLEWRLALKGMGLFFLGLSPYLFLPIRASMEPVMNEADPSTWGRFFELIRGGDTFERGGSGPKIFGGGVLDFGPAELPERFAIYRYFLLADFGWPLVLVGALGLAVLLVRNRPAAALLGSLYLGWLFHALEFEVFDVHIFFLPAHLMLALAVCVGAGGILDALQELAGSLPHAAAAMILSVSAAVLVAIPLFGVEDTLRARDMSEDYRGREIIEAVADNAEPGSTVLHHRSSLWYMVLVEKRRQDLTLVDPWFPGRTRYTDIVWPDDLNNVATDRRYKTYDHTGLSTAREVARDGPVYILDQDSVDARPFYRAGFETTRVEGDLFELVPPGREPYTPLEE